MDYSKAAGDYVLKRKFVKDAIPGKLEIMEDIFDIIKYEKPQPLNLEQFIKRHIPKIINPSNINKPSANSFEKT